jgi:small neutral amino acid transporter SnatA (MarC family)
VIEPARGRADLAVIGAPGASVIARVMGMLLAARAVSMVLSAIGDWLNLPKL